MLGAGFGRLLTVPFVASLLVLTNPNAGRSEPVQVRFREGVAHGFLQILTGADVVIGDGENTQFVRGNRVTTHLLLRFKDGSVYDDTTVFSQQGTFRLISNHLIQKGPSFKQAVDATIDVANGSVRIRSTDSHGGEKTHDEQIQLPPDLANGLLFTIIKDLQPNTKATVSLLTTDGSKPRLVTLEIVSEGQDGYSVGILHRKAFHYVVKTHIGGIAGAIAPIVGKQPPDLHIWISDGAAPSFIRFEGPLYEDGPTWHIQLAPPARIQHPRNRADPRRK